MNAKCSLLLLTLFALPAQACGVLTVSDAWARLAPPTATVMAAYATLGNAGEQSVLVQSASSKDFERVEVHSMTMDNGVMQMRKLDMLEIKVEQTLKLEPGGLHLMLIGPKRQFGMGDTIEVALRLCEENEQVVRFSVQESAPSADHPAHAH